MTCFYCGTELPAGAMFCGECGRPVNTKGGRSKSKAPVAEAVVETPVEAPAAEPEPLAEPEPEPEAVVAPEPIAEPQLVSVVEPEPDLEPLAEPEPEPEPQPEPAPAVIDLPEASVPAVPVAAPAPVAGPERCAQCGAPLSASDIFCPECGFVRHREGGRARPSDTNILDPFPWGLPRSTEPVAPHNHAPAEFEPDAPPKAVATDVPAKPFAEIADVSETRLVPRGPRGDRYVLQFSTGESVSVAGTGLVGRNPVAEPGEYVDTLIAIVDPGRSVSKTHLEFGQDDTSFWVSDRYSGNGTVVREPDREPRRCEAGKRYRVTRGARVEIGEQFFIVS